MNSFSRFLKGGLQRNVLATIILFQIARLLYAKTRGNEFMAGLIPDDGFYYIVISHNLNKLNLFSVDGGQTTATGFHLLWLLLSSVLERILILDYKEILYLLFVVLYSIHNMPSLNY